MSGTTERQLGSE